MPASRPSRAQQHIEAAATPAERPHPRPLPRGEGAGLPSPSVRRTAPVTPAYSLRHSGESRNPARLPRDHRGRNNASRRQPRRRSALTPALSLGEREPDCPRRQSGVPPPSLRRTPSVIPAKAGIQRVRLETIEGATTHRGGNHAGERPSPSPSPSARGDRTRCSASRSGWGRGGVAPTERESEGGWAGRAARSARSPGWGCGGLRGILASDRNCAPRKGRAPALKAPLPFARPASALTPALSLGERGPDGEEPDKRAGHPRVARCVVASAPEGYSSGCSCSSSARGEAGSEVMRRSVASWIALAIAASGGTIGTSPTPRTP